MEFEPSAHNLGVFRSLNIHVWFLSLVSRSHPLSDPPKSYTPSFNLPFFLIFYLLLSGNSPSDSTLESRSCVTISWPQAPIPSRPLDSIPVCIPNHESPVSTPTSLYFEAKTSDFIVHRISTRRPSSSTSVVVTVLSPARGGGVGMGTGRRP